MVYFVKKVAETDIGIYSVKSPPLCHGRMAYVMCGMSCVRCQLSHVSCCMSQNWSSLSHRFEIFQWIPNLDLLPMWQNSKCDKTIKIKLWQNHTVQVALYFRGLLSIRGRLPVWSKCSLYVQKTLYFLFLLNIQKGTQ